MYVPDIVDRYASGNEISARVILTDVDRHGGEDAALVLWARLYLRRTGGTRKAAA
jgi:hypothetical protein